MFNSIEGMLLTVAMAVTGSEMVFPQPGEADEPSFPQPSFLASNSGGKRILVAYASRTGATAEVAEAIAQSLSETGSAVDVRLVDEVEAVSDYQAVVAGSAIRSGQWLPEAIAFIKKHQASLSKLPVAYFLSCLSLSGSDLQARSEAMKYLQPSLEAAPAVKPFAAGVFGGVLNYSKLNIFTRLYMRGKMAAQGISEGDFRNWDRISEWAQGLRCELA